MTPFSQGVGSEGAETTFVRPGQSKLPRPEQREMPVNIYETVDGICVTAPMPGVCPKDITIEVMDSEIVVRGGVTGVRQEQKHYLRHEWAYGPYGRTVELPSGVDAGRANATFGNGVLIVDLPRVEQTLPGRIQLRQAGPAKGFAAGHSGRGATAAGHEPPSLRRTSVRRRRKRR